jgi:hypothetical protein
MAIPKKYLAMSQMFRVALRLPPPTTPIRVAATQAKNSLINATPVPTTTTLT